MSYLEFITTVHTKTNRNYLERVTTANKAECAEKAKQFGYDYWDGDRKYGFGGYYYDGRWRSVAEKIATHYNLKSGSKVLDVGCGKGFLLYELSQVVEGLQVTGIDISAYAIEHSKEEVKGYLLVGSAQNLPFEDNAFDLVITINTLHNLYLFDLYKSIQEINRVSKKDAYIEVESYRNESEKVNLMYWQLTCECIFTPKEWEFIFEQNNFQGDYEFIFFE